LVTDITDNVVTTRQGDQVEQISARTIYGRWRQSFANGAVLAKRTGAQLDRVGRVVEPDLSVGHPIYL